MSAQKYSVICKLNGRIKWSIGDLTYDEAIETAKTHSYDKWTEGLVFITWFRSSDGQAGYVNPSGDHAITGQAWNK